MKKSTACCIAIAVLAVSCTARETLDDIPSLQILRGGNGGGLLARLRARRAESSGNDDDTEEGPLKKLLMLKMLKNGLAPSATAAAAGTCKDDPTGDLAKKGQSCAKLTTLLTCDTELNSVRSNVPPGVFVKTVCPKTCNAC